MIYPKTTDNFNSEFDIVGILIDYNDSMLLLKRDPRKPQGGTWGAPGGKVEKGETLEQAIKRETYEETGIALDPEVLTFFDSYFVRYGDHDFIYHLYSYKAVSKPEIFLEQGGHVEYGWYSKDDALKLDLIHDMDFCIEAYMKRV